MLLFPLTQIIKAVLYAFALILALIALFMLLQTLLMMWEDLRNSKEEDSDIDSALDGNIQPENSFHKSKKEKKKAKKAQKEESSKEFFYYDHTRMSEKRAP